MIDISLNIIYLFNKINIAHITVFSGRAFIWAEWGAWFLKRFHVPVILSLHGGNLPDFSKKHTSRVWRLLKSADSVVSPSNYLIKNLVQFRSDIQMVPNPIDLTQFKFRLRKQIRPILIWVRAFHEIYNPCMAIEVVRQLKADFPDIHLIMLGSDKGDGSLQKTKNLVKRYNLESNISFAGLVEHTKISGFFDKADIFINTTNIDNTPVSVMEAMASGLCVVSTNVGGMPYLIEDKSDGFLVPPDNPVIFAETIRKVLENQALAHRAIRNAKEKTKTWSWEKVLPMWIQIIQKYSRK